MTVISKRKLSEKVVEEIRARLDKGIFNIGEKLPNQNKLSQELGISRTSLREAMHLLDLLGVIDQKPGFGTVIRKKIPDVTSQEVNPVLMADSEATRELLEARLAIEPDMARFTARNATPEQIATLKRMVEKMDQLLENGDYEAFAQKDLNFHAKISEISGNRFLNDAFRSIKRHMELFINEHTVLVPNVLKESQKHHQSIYNAIESKAPELAELQMNLHIVHLKESYKKYNENNTGQTPEP